MVKLITIFLTLFLFALSSDSAKQWVYCLHFGEGSIHVEEGHVDCNIKQNEIHVKAIGEGSLSFDNEPKPAVIFYSIPLLDECLLFFQKGVPAVKPLTKDPPLFSVKLLI